jgi:hypothetical protein
VTTRPPENPRATSARILFGIYVAVALLASIWPVYPWLGARVEPRILGLPFAFAWTIGWILATFLALVIFHRAVSREEDR